MIHTLFSNYNEDSISVKTKNNITNIKTVQDNRSLEIELEPKELSDFIGILLHVQAKIKRDGRQ